MIRAHHPEPCWGIHDRATGYPPENEDAGEGWQHYREVQVTVTYVPEGC